MDHPSTAQKLRAMRNPKKRNNNNFPSIYNLILQLLIAFFCTLLFSYSSWLPFLKQFLFISIPSVISSYILSPKCLFVVANIIVFALIGESKLGGSAKPSPCHEMYDEYVKNRSWSVGKEAEVGKRVRGVHEKKFTGLGEEGLEREVVCVEDRGKEEEIPNDEVNRRAEEFIARVNRQRWLEARSLMNLPVQDYGRKIAVHG